MGMQEMETVTCLLTGVSHFTSELGRTILIILSFIRFGILAVGSQTLWKDEEMDFSCNSTQLLCQPSCFDEYCPISSFNLFSLQLVVLFTLSLSLICYMPSKYKNREGSLLGHLQGRNQLKLHILHLLSRILIESIFIVTFFKVSPGLLQSGVAQCHSVQCEAFVICVDLKEEAKQMFSIGFCAASAVSGFICLGELLSSLRSIYKAKKTSHTKQPYSKQLC
ncbi:hypothetical protein XENTR_v10001281 [Xenopus tropicalis]|uniref:Gap junction beta-1 protein-like n=1 Tax=Xenopus tropicalis TaxID=8364 RepID=A0A6I8SV26_XENTR|nr:gap junction beta-1 protein-like [Xenopus tropicalis]KAE8631701.1 hypothetical protein XENTR_v10001281 [Xenopus tropicalis]|eukprot:XP_004911072.1 PREDICTED: gap junction beta-1 protein-like [Xenopus tropicalis]